MMRTLNLIAVLLIVAAGVSLYQLKYNTQHLQQDVAQLRQQIAADNEAIKVLRAEWTYLSRPGRIEALGSRYLALKPVRAEQSIASLDEIPFREDPHAVVAQVDDFRQVSPHLVRGPEARPAPPAAKPAPRTVPMPVTPAEDSPRILEVRHAPEPQRDDPLAFIRQLRFVSAIAEEVHD